MFVQPGKSSFVLVLFANAMNPLWWDVIQPHSQRLPFQNILIRSLFYYQRFLRILSCSVDLLSYFILYFLGKQEEDDIDIVFGFRRC